MKDRIKALRKSLGLSQARFAEALNVSISTAQKWEIDVNTPTPAIVRLMSEKFGVSESWILSGTGEMFEPKDKEQELAKLVGKLMRDDTPEFRRRLISVLSRLDDNGWDVLEKIADSLTKKD